MPFKAHMRKNGKDVLVSRTFGKKVRVKDFMSSICLEVSEGVRSVVMQSVNCNFYLVRKSIPSRECLAAPIVQLHIEEENEQDNTIGYKYKLTIPHYISRHPDQTCIKVKCGSLKQPQRMRTIEKGSPKTQTLPCWEINRKGITVYANHFCTVVCTSTQKICTSKILAIPFGWIGHVDSEPQTHMKVKVYLCSYLYSNIDLKQASIFSTLCHILSNLIDFVFK